MPCHRTSSQVPIVEFLEKGPDVVAINCRRRFSQALKKSREFREVAAITQDAIGRQPLLDTRKVQKKLHFRDKGGMGRDRGRGIHFL